MIVKYTVSDLPHVILLFVSTYLPPLGYQFEKELPLDSYFGSLFPQCMPTGKNVGTLWRFKFPVLRTACPL